MSDSLADSIARVRERIAAAATRAGRQARDITLIAVTKRQAGAVVRAAVEAGLTDLGENYVQEALAKQEATDFTGFGVPRWHLIGHLQTNKSRQAVSAFDLIQSIDSLRLAQAVGRQAQALGKAQDVLLQVHLGDEATKTGLAPETVADVAAEAAGQEGLRVRGLMGIAPGGVDPRPHFAALRRHFERLPEANRGTLSMGMTGDFETAIAEGATMVRVGTAIFGPRQ